MFRSSLSLRARLACVSVFVLLLSAPAMADPSLGVMPTASAKRVRGKALKKLVRLDQQLAKELNSLNPQMLRKSKREKVLRIKAKKLAKTSLKRAKKKGVSFVLTNVASGKGKRLSFRFSLLDVKTGKSVWQKKLSPAGKHRKTWASTVAKGVAPFISTQEQRDSAAAPIAAKQGQVNGDVKTNKETEAAQSPAANAAQPNPGSDKGDKVAADQATATSADNRSTDNSSSGQSVPAQDGESKPATAPSTETASGESTESGGLAWLWYGSGGVVGLMGVGALVGAGVVGFLALNDSNAFVASAAQNTELRQSSETKALVADVLWATGGVFTIAAVGLVSAGVVSNLTE